MKLKMQLVGLVAAMLLAGIANAATLRVIVVQTTDVHAYVQALEQGKALMKAKGTAGVVRVWKATYAGDMAGTVVVSVEYASLEELAKVNAQMGSDPELRTWLAGLDKLRKIVSDSLYEEVKP